MNFPRKKYYMFAQSALSLTEEYPLLTPWNSTHFQLNRNFRELNTTEEEEAGAASHGGGLVLVYAALHSAGALLGMEVRNKN